MIRSTFQAKRKAHSFIHGSFIHGSFIREQIKTARVIFFACDVLMSFLNLQGNGDKKQIGTTKTTFNFGDFLPTTIG